MNIISKIIDSIKRDGVFRTFKTGSAIIYNKYSSINFPKYTIEMNGVLVDGRDYEIGKFPWEIKGVPNYESGLISGITNHVNKGDSVVIVGGGLGVTATKAAQQVGRCGEVHVYEGSSKQIEIINRTLAINNTTESVEIHHSIVGQDLNVYGDTGDADYISPKELPDCDVLELDCEGSEISILENIQIRPNVILVESHGVYGSPTSEVINVLKRNGYEIDHKEIAEKQYMQLHLKEDVYAVTALFDNE